MMTAPGFIGASDNGPNIISLARDTVYYEDSTDAATFTSDARGIGTASATRRVYALIASSSSVAGGTLTSVTIGGISATIDVQVDIGDVDFDNTLICAIASAVVPTGTTAVIVANFNMTLGGFAAGVIALDNVQNATAFDTATGNSGANTTVVNTQLDFASGGYVMAISAGYNSPFSDLTGSCLWTSPLIETVDDSTGGSPLTLIDYSVAYLLDPSASANNTIQATWTDHASGHLALAAITVR